MIRPGAGGSLGSRQIACAGALAIAITGLDACALEMLVGAIDEDATTTGAAPGGGGSDPAPPIGGQTHEGGAGGDGGRGAAPPACGVTWEEPQPVVAPLDIVIVVDNSGSMQEEIAAIEQNINVNFAQILLATKIDFQVVVVSNHGPGPKEICVQPPLSSTSDCHEAPGDLPGRFHHYDVDVQSRDGLCRLLETFRGDVPDQWGHHPAGWSQRLRAEAEKAFVMFTDDRVACTAGALALDDQGDTHPNPQLSAAAAAATAFDHALSAADAHQFGTVSNRRYRFYSAVGVKEKGEPYQDEAHHPWEPIVPAKCQTAMNVGPGYQWLSKGTDAGRYSLCAPQSYDALFQELAADIIADATLPCVLQLTSSVGDPSELVVAFTPGGASDPVIWSQVASAEACADAGAFYLEGDRLRLCPTACESFESDLGATFEVSCAPAP